jgi:hypothetical protein
VHQLVALMRIFSCICRQIKNFNAIYAGKFRQIKKPGAYPWPPKKPDCYKMQKLKTGKKTTVVRIEDSLLRQAIAEGFVLSLLKL